MLLFLSLALAGPDVAIPEPEVVAVDSEVDVPELATIEVTGFACGIYRPPTRSKVLGQGAGAAANGHVLLTSSAKLDDYKDAMSQPTLLSVIPAAGLPHGRMATLDVLALVPGARNGPTGWTLGGQPVQLYMDGTRISTEHSFF